MVNAADAVLAGQAVDLLDKSNAIQLTAVKRHRYALFKSNLSVFRLIGGLFRRVYPDKGIFGGLKPGVFHNATFDASPPQVLVYRVGAFRRNRNGYAMTLSIVNGLVTGHFPVTSRG